MIGLKLITLLSFLAQHANPSAFDGGYGSAGIIPREAVVCNNQGSAEIVAKAISDIRIPTDGVEAYDIFLALKPDCNIVYVALGAYEAVWQNVRNPQFKVSVSESVTPFDPFEFEEAQQYFVFAPKSLMREFTSCREFVERFETIEGCEIPI